ncbi:organoarsenical effux MFS transporter ArsJ [Ilumatobacter coccineus]|uniref:Putative major facilitator superfamily transporter n=1 Tax=Ilumatobacter coccineus (strain NBRC 103263 / KCTC 29153 / YM16-304) TaxID=1313172 RepID=A0A6C7E745_ILUCY|nr:organoarsenical effux MFS transporter ArsJ [Ilumatobacter coccineus]BAN00995.1 putative major facilitator superfamily transporter [Ilumatobacter coccineus YM16-304]
MQLRNYILVTAGYWAYTLTDGALRVLVLLHFNDLGYSPVAIAFLFLAYEFMGIVTNLIGGWVGARTGLSRTLVAGLSLQIVALGALTFQQAEWAEWLSVTYVMGAQALSGVAKDLTKMSSKSAVKFIAGDGDGALFKMVAVLTGSKNALKGIGFFVGAALLAWLGYDTALWSMAAFVAVSLAAVALLLNEDIGKSKKKPPLRSILSKSTAINRLAVARFFLFASRDIWFVVALPVFLDEELGWSFYGVGGFLAAWTVGYGIVQSSAPRWLRRGSGAHLDEVAAARVWALALGVVSAALATLVAFDIGVTAVVVGGLFVFGVAFALNSSLHSYLILAYSDDDDVSVDVGFYYSANAAGRLVGTLLSGLLYLWGGLAVALWGAAAFVAITWLLTLRLPAIERPAPVAINA